MKVAIIIPAYNEEKTIEVVIREVGRFGTPLVVDDFSTDKTAEIAERIGAVVVRHDTNKGYDQALNSGFAKALEIDCSHAITFDADGQHPVSQIPDYISAFENGRKLVVGIRPKAQRISEKIFALYTGLRFGIRDPLCGMKGYDLRLYSEIGFFDSYGSTGTELMLRYLRKGAVPSQIPLKITARHDQPRFGRLIRANTRILKSLIKSWSYLK